MKAACVQWATVSHALRISSIWFSLLNMQPYCVIYRGWVGRYCRVSIFVTHICSTFGCRGTMHQMLVFYLFYGCMPERIAQLIPIASIKIPLNVTWLSNTADSAFMLVAFNLKTKYIRLTFHQSKLCLSQYVRSKNLNYSIFVPTPHTPEGKKKGIKCFRFMLTRWVSVPCGAVCRCGLWTSSRKWFRGIVNFIYFMFRR